MILFIVDLFLEHSLGFYFGLIVFGLMFTPLLTRRKYFPLRAFVGLVVCLVVIYFVPDYRIISVAPSTKTLVIYLSYICLLIFCYTGSVKSFVFVAAAALTTQHMSLCISDVFTIVCQIEDDFFYIVASLGGGIVCFFATYFVFARRLKGVNEVRIANPTLTFVAVFVFLFTFLAQRVVTTFETITASFRFFDGLTCFLSLFILFIELEKNNEAWERQMVQELMVSEQKRYALLERSMDAINRKCHDLKYASKAWKAAKNDESMSEDELDEYVDVYDNIAQTGFAPLDNVLTEKSLYCEKNDILFTYIVDGGKLQFMQFIDIAVLFGNALDNAIECVMKYPESEKRIISLNVSEKEGAVRIHIENYCENAPEFVGGLPVSWKEDKQNHGYGLKSIRYIVEKYHGMFAVDCKNRMFNLNVSFPLGD